MANELKWHSTSGTFYRTIWKAGGTIWNINGTPNFEAYNAANWTASKYCPPLTSRGGGYYEGDWPTGANMPAGAYSLQIRLQMGANPSVTDDPIVYSEEVAWDGSSRLSLGSLATPTNITAGTIANLTNLPAAPGDWITASAIKADAVTKIQTGLATPTNITAASGVTLAVDQAVNVTKWNGGTLPTIGTSTFNPATDKVYLANGAHGGSSATITLQTPIAASGNWSTVNPDNTGIGDIKTLLQNETYGLSAIVAHGDSAWVTADVSGLSTFDPATQVVGVGGYATGQDPATLLTSTFTALQSHGDSTWVTADVSGVATTIIEHGDDTWTTADISGLASQTSVDSISQKVVLLTSGQVTSAAPVRDDGTVVLISGDGYTGGRALTWSISDYTGSSVAGATVTLRIVPTVDYTSGDNEAELEVTGSATMDGTTAVFSVELTGDETGALSSTTPPNDSPNYVYQLTLTPSGESADEETIAIGNVVVQEGISPIPVQQG